MDIAEETSCVRSNMFIFLIADLIYNKPGQLQRNRLDKSCSTNKITRSKQ
jgi:hypothetical protein